MKFTTRAKLKKLDTTLRAIQNEMMSRRRELIDAEKRQGGGTVGIQLKSEKLLYCYRKGRNPEPFYLTGALNGMMNIWNESDLLLA